MIDTAGTIVQAAEALKANGAAKILVAATHAILSGPAVQRLTDSPDRRGRRHQHPAHHAGQAFDRLTVLSIAPLLARAIREIFDDGSVTSLFEPHSA